MAHSTARQRQSERTVFCMHPNTLSTGLSQKRNAARTNGSSDVILFTRLGSSSGCSGFAFRTYLPVEKRDKQSESG